ncbi:MAG: hypothetical protein NTW14_08600 [bacterium]|nr:hypothetical protein [bacterium]
MNKIRCVALAERISLRHHIVLIVMALMLPLTAWSARITSVDCSAHPKNNFAILVLHFDQETAYQVNELEGGTAVRFSASDCDVDPAAAAKLSGISNELIKTVTLGQASGALTLNMNFSGAANVRVREAKDPFSLILDISLSKAGAKAPVKKPAEEGTKAKKPVENQQALENRKPKPELPAKAQSTEPEKRRTTRSPAGEDSADDTLSPQGHFDRGVALSRSGQFDTALEHLQKARQDSDLFSKATAEIASIYRSQGRTADAINEWEKFFSTVDKQGLAEKIYSESAPALQNAPQIVKYDTPASQLNPQAAQSEKTTSGLPPIEQSHDGHLWEYFLYLVIAIITTAVYLLHRSNRSLHRKILILLQGGEDDEPETREVKSRRRPVEDDVPEALMPVRPPDFLVEDENPEPPPPARPELVEEEPEPVTDTVQEVYNLTMQGLSIQEVAERMGLGQDEVRLIMNLQRDESVIPGQKR